METLQIKVDLALGFEDRVHEDPGIARGVRLGLAMAPHAGLSSLKEYRGTSLIAPS